MSVNIRVSSEDVHLCVGFFTADKIHKYFNARKKYKKIKELCSFHPPIFICLLGHYFIK